MLNFGGLSTMSIKGANSAETRFVLILSPLYLATKCDSGYGLRMAVAASLLSLSPLQLINALTRETSLDSRVHVSYRGIASPVFAFYGHD